jgi:hypothetical protein
MRASASAGEKRTDCPGGVPLGHKMPLYMAVLYACLEKFVNGN